MLPVISSTRITATWHAIFHMGAAWHIASAFVILFFII